MQGFGPAVSSRNRVMLFWLGCVAVTAGVLLHLPMFLMSGDMGYHLAGMPMDDGMLFGMSLIVAGVAAAAFGLVPPRSAETSPDMEIVLDIASERDLAPMHWVLAAALTVGLVIDTMKPATLGFLIPGMTHEYGLSHTEVAVFPFSALLGTAIGSLVWGFLADIYGRRASILLSAIMFAATSICGFMPSFAWNIFMCFLMGLSAGGMIPVCYALLTECIPARHRGWMVVLVGGLGTLGGFLAASGFSAILQPVWGWRIMWFLGLPTGLSLILLSQLVPESPKFLILHGRTGEAAAALGRFGIAVRFRERVAAEEPVLIGRGLSLLATAKHAGVTAALVIAGLGWGLLNFGLLLWLPASLEARGYDVVLTSSLLAQSTLIAFPTMFVVAIAYGWWSTKGSLVAALTVSLAGLAGMITLDSPYSGVFGGPIPFLVMLVVGANAIIATILPYAAENYPLAMRGRATGVIAASTKIGGVAAQLVGVSGIFLSLGVMSAMLIAAMALAILLVVSFGAETRGLVLRDTNFTDAAWG